MNIELFKTFLQNGEYDKARLLSDFMLDSQNPYYTHQKKLILFMFSLIDEKHEEEQIMAYTIISPDVTLNPREEERNKVIAFILNHQYRKAMISLNNLINDVKEMRSNYHQFDLILKELSIVLCQKRDREQKFLCKLYREERYQDILNYLDEEARKHRLSRTNSIFRKLIRVYLTILETNEVPVILPKNGNINCLSTYLDIEDYENAYQFLLADVAQRKKFYPETIYLDLLNKINLLISQINKNNGRDASPTMSITTDFDSASFTSKIEELMPEIAENGLVILESADKITNQMRKDAIKNMPNLSSFKIGDNLEQLVVLKSNELEKSVAMELMTKLRNAYNDNDYESVITIGKKLIEIAHPNVRDLLIIAMSYLRLGVYDLGCLYLNVAINLGRRIDKDTKTKSWRYWDLENILEHFEEENRVQKVDKGTHQK